MFLNDKPIAHRGLHDGNKIIENSMEAFKLAKEKGYTIEIDVHLTKDNKVIVFHDYNTKRITNIDMVIEKSTYEELNSQHIHYIPLLEEVLNLIDGKVGLLIEIKNESKVGPLEEKLMKILSTYKGEYAIQSFNPMVLYYFKRKYPKVLRGQLSFKYKENKMILIEKICLKNMIFNKITKPNFISYKYDELKISKILKYKKKYMMLGWTVKSKNDYNNYKKYYDNLICEQILN